MGITAEKNKKLSSTASSGATQADKDITVRVISWGYVSNWKMLTIVSHDEVTHHQVQIYCIQVLVTSSGTLIISLLTSPCYTYHKVTTPGVILAPS